MRKYFQYLVLAFMTAVFIGGQGCGNSAMPTIQIDGADSQTVGVQDGAKISVKLNIDAPEGFSSLDVTSDKGFSDNIESIEDTFSVTYEIDASAKTPSSEEVFTFKVNDKKGQSATVTFTAIYTDPLLKTVILQNAYDQNAMDGISLDNKAFIDFVNAQVYSRTELEAANPKPVIDAAFIYFDLEGGPLLDQSDTVPARQQYFDMLNNVYTLEIRSISESDFNDVKNALGSQKFPLIENAFVNGNAGTDNIASNPYLAILLNSSNKKLVLHAELQVNGEGLSDDTVTLNYFVAE